MVETQRTILKSLSSDDVEVLFSYRSLPEVYEFQSWAPQKVEDAISFIDKFSGDTEIKPGQWKQLGIYHKEDEILIGDCGFCVFEDKQGEIGYTISPKYQRQGFGLEIVEALIDFLFRETGIHRIVAKTDPANIGSIKILERVGFRKQGHFIKSVKIRGEWKDDLVLAILREDWK